MKTNPFFKSALIWFLVFLYGILVLPPDVSAASAGTENTAIGLSSEEKAYLDRSGEITIGCPIQNSPLLFENEKTGQLEGITIDILNMISENIGLPFRYQLLPSGSITYETLTQLQIDIVAGVENNNLNEHAIGIAMTDPYLHAEKVFVCRRGEIFQPDGAMTIAVDSGSQTLEGVIKQHYPQFQVSFYNSIDEALSALLSGKADAVLQNQYTIERLLSKPVYEDLQIVATASIGDSHCLGCLVPVSENHENIISDETRLLLSVLNKGIGALDQDEISFLIIRETAENAYQFTIWDMLYRYRYAVLILLISLILILALLRRIHLLNQKRSEQLAVQQRAKELTAINAHMKEQQLLLMDALKRAEDGNRAKSTFLFNMSHDIRTPMNAILGFAEIASRSRDDTARLTDCLEKIQVSGQHLLHLINDVLDMSKIDNGKLTLTEDCCDLADCIEKARDMLLTEIEKKHLTFQTDLSAVKNTSVYCDRLRIEQILFNLVSNAVKFTNPGGSILVTLRQNPCAIKEYAAYELRVKDTGIGMSPEFLARIFDPFERENTSTISHTQGTGLGMSITKNLVDLMGGTIQVSSEPGRGSEFVLAFTFKLQEQTGKPQQPCTAAFPAYDFSGKRLLLVEDNELNMEIAQELLCDVGFLVETAQNGQIAVEKVRNSNPGYYDAVLMDIQMPVMNGYLASRTIRSLESRELSEIPIIALTANAFDEDKKEALANGMNAHIAKPVDAGVLYETLANVLKNQQL